jgi:very-short-patch-repair endonuclease/rubrerythrin
MAQILQLYFIWRFIVRKKTEEDYKNITKSRSIVWDVVEIPKDTNTKTWWKCKVCGYRWKAKYVKIQQNRGCPKCNNRIPKIKKDYHNIVKNRGIVWIGEELPRTTKIDTRWLCLGCGNVWETKYNEIHNLRGCPVCGGNIPKTEKDYHELAESRGFKWVGPFPKSTHVPTLWECEYGDRWEAHYNSIQQGNGCPICSNRVSKTESDYHVLAEYRGLKWIGSFPKTTHYKTWWECDNHKFKISYNNVQASWGYSKHSDMVNGSLVSKPQRKLNSILHGSLNYPEGKYRIDVAIMRSSQKIAVEYDCCYWHKGNENYDAERDKYLISKGWKVLHVKSRNLIPNKKQLKNKINKLLFEKNIVNMFLEDWKM